jgi:predicted nucleic acid-binding protein
VIIYVDTSSPLKLLIDGLGSERAEIIWDSADTVVSCTLVFVEARVALAAAERGNRLTKAQHQKAKSALRELVDDLMIVEITGALVADAADLAEAQALWGYDAVHLAAGLTVEATVLTSADFALCDAARGLGLHGANPLED